jgi:hypothetical protein
MRFHGLDVWLFPREWLAYAAGIVARLTRLRAPARIAVMWIRFSTSLAAIALSLTVFGACSAQAVAGDAKALAQGFKDEEACNKPYAESLDAKAFINCLNALDTGYKGTAAVKQSYIVGVGFNAWSLANFAAARQEQELFPDITSRAKASKPRQVAMRLFDVFRPAQKQQKIADADLAKLAGADLAGLKPVLDYYDALPKK